MRKEIEKYLKDKNHVLGIICKIDSNENEYNHVFFTLPKEDEKNPDYMADKLEIMVMKDVSIWCSSVKDAMKEGLKCCEDFYNYDGG